MAKQTTKPEFEIRKIDLTEPVFCACNGLLCSGECRKTHLQNGRTGVCTAAYNDRKKAVVHRRAQEDKIDYDRNDVYSVWLHLDD